MLIVLSDCAAQKGLSVCITSHLLGHSVETEPLHYLGSYGCPPSCALPSALWHRKEDSLVYCAVVVIAPSQPVELTYCVYSVWKLQTWKTFVLVHSVSYTQDVFFCSTTSITFPFSSFDPHFHPSLSCPSEKFYINWSFHIWLRCSYVLT